MTSTDLQLNPLHSTRWSECLRDPLTTPTPDRVRALVGVLRGEGIGPEVIGVTLDVLQAVAATHGFDLALEFGGDIGRPAESRGGTALSEDVSGFCGDLFARGGAILSGPGGGRYVYDLRTRFDLFCKLNPIVVPPELSASGRMRPEHTRGIDLLIVREGASGLYQGQWERTDRPGEDRRSSHTFSYSEAQVRRVVLVAAKIALRRRRKLSVIYKESGAPTISNLWQDCARDIAATVGVDCEFVDIDYAAYRLLQQPRDFDVIVAPNLFGDILSDLGGVLLGSRALTYGGNFSAEGAAGYQTNHGAAYDLAGTDRANPIGQIFSGALLLKESFGLTEAAESIHTAVRSVWRAGWRTADLAEAGCRVVGTRSMGALVVDAVRTRASTLR